MEMDILEYTIEKYLTEADPSLKRPRDGKVFDLAFQDFRNYLKYKNISTFTTEDIEAFVSIWLSKWKQRTALILSEEEKERYKKQDLSTKNIKEFVLNSEELDGLIELAKFTLLEKGELCGLEIIARELVRKAIREYSENRKIEQESSEEQRILVLKEISDILTRNCRRASETSGYLIYIMVDRRYYFE
jgi:hypothetical protein